MAKKARISNNVIRRLPRYLRRLDDLAANGIMRISSAELGDQLGLTPSQIRQDFSCFGEFGQQGYGYNVIALREQIAGVLGTGNGYRAVLIGVGNIGRALICNFDFKAWGFDLVEAFDIKPELIGTTISNVHISSMDDLASYLTENQIDMAVMTVPRSVALEITDIVTENGVNAIWNFTGTDLVEPGSPVIVENIHFADSLLSLSYFLTKDKEEQMEEYGE